MAHIKNMVIHGFKSFARKTEIPFDEQINLFVGANGSGKCLTGESLVQLSDGSIERIDRIVEEGIRSRGTLTEDGFIAPGNGVEVMCLDFDTLKIINKPIKAFVKKTSPEKLLKIKTRSGKEVTTTKYHPLFILKNGKVVPARADELRIGQRVAIPRGIDFEPKSNKFLELLEIINPDDNIYIPYKEEFEFILRSIKVNLSWKEVSEKIGISQYVIKGLLDKQAIKLAYLIKILRYGGISDSDIIELIDEIRMNGKNTKFNFSNSPEFSRFFGYVLAEGRLTPSSNIWFTNGNEDIVEDYVGLVKKLFNKNPLVREYKAGCWDVIFYSEPLRLILKKLGMASQTEKKFISNILLKHSSKIEIANLISGLYSGDGFVSKDKPVVDIVTKSERLAEGITSCLLRLGIVPRKRKVIKGIKKRGFSGEYQLISFYGVENMTSFSSQVELVHKMKRDRLSYHITKKANPNVDLIEANHLVKEITLELGINVKERKKEFSILSSYCYNQCTPSRQGLALLNKEVFSGQSVQLKKLNQLVKSDIFWDELVEVEEVEGEEWVYDLCVEKDHNFIANNIFVHNSNVADALCFALGRLSIKSMRAAKAKNLIFMGSKYIKPAREAYVELVFDNKDKAFSIDKDEISLKRVVRHKGQSLYKINGETKTRNEVIEMLAQAGIDPYGFNLIMQGQIQSIVKMPPEERRKIIEEVAGISIYESRKEKSLKELTKTDERLKEISTILRVRTSYLNNLEKERAQAQKFKDSELLVKRCKASIVNLKLKDKDGDVAGIVKSISEKNVSREKMKEQGASIQGLLDDLNSKIEDINKHIQKAGGVEQETLHNEVANLKATLEGLKVRSENYENRRAEIERRVEEIGGSIPEMELEIKSLKEKSPLMAKKSEELKRKKTELSLIEDERKKLFGLRGELDSLKYMIKDKESQLARSGASSESLLKGIEEIESSVEFEGEAACFENIEILKNKHLKAIEKIDNLVEKKRGCEKIISVSESKISESEKIKTDIEKIDICPLCQSKMTEKHLNHVNKEIGEKIKLALEESENSLSELKSISLEKEKLENEIKNLGARLSKGEVELVNHRNIIERKEQMKKIVENEKNLIEEIKKLEESRKKLELKSGDLSKIEEKYERKILEIEEISSRTEEDIDTTLLYKERELENMRNIIKRSVKDLEDVELQIEEINKSIGEKSDMLEKKEKYERELNEKFKKLFESRDGMQKEIQENNLALSEKQSEIRQMEDQINYLKIGKAKLDAEKEALEMEVGDFGSVELLKGNLNHLAERLEKSNKIVQNIGAINLKALEVYEKVKDEYDRVREKVNILSREKEDIMKIVEEIDKKKKKAFMKTFKAINDLFSNNFSKLSSKGVAYLDIENKENIFDGGVNIIVKFAKGKYFDVTSLSGGEQTLVALSLLFAVQEHKPYHFYIFDEIDAALDKRNSERLAGLLKQYMKAGQYIVISHNDAIILGSNVLYGVSMQEGVSKILSLKLNEETSAHEGKLEKAETPGISERVNDG